MSIPTGIVDAFLFVLALYYFLRDGGAFLRWLLRISPFQGHDTEDLFCSIPADDPRGAIGQLVTSAVQGALTTIALAIFLGSRQRSRSASSRRRFR